MPSVATPFLHRSPDLSLHHDLHAMIPVVGVSIHAPRVALLGLSLASIVGGAANNLSASRPA